MKSRTARMLFVGVCILGLNQASLRAAYVEGQNWADRVVEHTSRIQRFGQPGCAGGQFMDPNNRWWILGPPDCDVDGDGNAWSVQETEGVAVDRDAVAGWKGGGALNQDQELVVAFDVGLEDYLDSTDLVIRLYSGYQASASVWASVDGNDFTQLGAIVGKDDGLPGIPGKLVDVYFDFGGRFDDVIRYVKLHRNANGPDTGMFFDAIGSALVVVPEACDCEPNSCAQIHDYGWNLSSDLVADCCIDEQDYEVFHSYFGLCNDPEDPNCGATDFDALGYRPSCCHGMWQSGLGLPADFNHDCRVDFYDLQIMVDQWPGYKESRTCHGCEPSEASNDEAQNAL